VGGARVEDLKGHACASFQSAESAGGSANDQANLRQGPCRSENKRGAYSGTFSTGRSTYDCRLLPVSAPAPAAAAAAAAGCSMAASTRAVPRLLQLDEPATSSLLNLARCTNYGHGPSPVGVSLTGHDDRRSRANLQTAQVFPTLACTVSWDMDCDV
jgi:hypothetical protein